ncbi:histone acetyltransferase KAT6A-like isoform X2 [Nymphalis io]|uniref:histone acetyltransferase KAT6A-like isoform X2 n=1 Tax=Inachis io TaxID=171585 RepID=UPI00216700CD|nr:histone acetyltransferase KAT6A-like isoform X2 [Nymphalis io]
MNPPSALYGAMNKERKPFTYTPGGLDLSEIKSERMAKRLMRNAMSEGVPETPAQTLKSPPVTPGTIPNFNCLPVQVFPTFQLPANPKSLLKTRSISDAPKESPSSNNPPTSTLSTNKYSNDSWREINKPSSEFSNNNISSNYKPAVIDNYKKTTSIPTTILQNYGSYSSTDILLPEKSYDAKYFQSEPQGTITDIGRKWSGTEEKTQQYENSQKQVKIVKKQTNTENESDPNGDTEAAVFIKLPTKTSAAKTETKVEVLKKILPDGTIEEIKKTITKTTKDGKTEISTKTETRTIPKEVADDVVEIEEEEDEIEDDVEVNDNEDDVEVSKEDFKSKVTESKENGEETVEQSDDEVVSEKTKTEVKENRHIITGEEKLESSTTKKVVVIQSTGEESEEEIEEEVEEEEQEEDGDVDVEEVVIIKKPTKTQPEENENENVEDTEEIENAVEITKEIESDEQEKEIEQEEEIEDEEEKENVEKSASNKDVENVLKETEASDENEQESEEKVQKTEIENVVEEDNSLKKENNEEVEESYEETEDLETKVEVNEKTLVTPIEEKSQNDINFELKAKEENKSNDKVDISREPVAETITTKEETKKQEIGEEFLHKTINSEPKVSFREPSIPFEKVEDIEIKPIGPAQEIIKKSHTEIITKTTDQPTGALSTQTEYNRIENVVTVNRTTKTLDHAYEQPQQTIPTLKTYFSPINDRVLTTPQPISKPYQPIYTPDPQTERRHSLLLDRLSVDRQVPTSDIYQNNYQSSQSYEQNQWSEEPQSEILTVSNVKPSTITKNQQWYQQTMKENVISNTVSPTPVLPSQIWNQQNQAPSHTQIPTQPQYQTFTQQQYTPKPEFQSSYAENNAQNIYKSNTNNAQSNIYPSYTPKPSWVSSTFDTKPISNTASNQYSSLKKESTESYQKSTQQFNSSYVPPPWEQDSSYITENQSYYQPPPTISYTPSINQTNQSWKPKPPPGKFSKATPTAYIPPAPNQSFVKPVTVDDTSKISGRKTYYSEYERRYISVPESTYVPNETKLSVQPDPSPQYYYDNNEPTEFVEPQWRKELREFTEKASQTTTQTENTSIRPPWEDDPKYSATSEYSATVTPSWTQTLRPRSWRERSYEPEYIGSKEWPKTNTLGRGRPQSSYVKSNINTIQERPRGVSVDRYNPNNYQSPLPSEHPPVQSHTLNPTIHPKTYHNPTVPAYHSRASAEPREQTTAYPKQRMRVDTRAPPVQSRSFKYLQWITGTED